MSMDGAIYTNVTVSAGGVLVVLYCHALLPGGPAFITLMDPGGRYSAGDVCLSEEISCRLVGTVVPRVSWPGSGPATAAPLMTELFIFNF